MRETDGGTRQSESDTDITDLDGEAWLVEHGRMVGWLMVDGGMAERGTDKLEADDVGETLSFSAAPTAQAKEGAKAQRLTYVSQLPRCTFCIGFAPNNDLRMVRVSPGRAVMLGAAGRSRQKKPGNLAQKNGKEARLGKASEVNSRS